jgi:hypothetical protein
MISDRGRAIAVLGRLVLVCREAEEHLRRAADRAGVDSLRGLLQRASLERGRFAHELEIEVQMLGGAGLRPGSGLRDRVRPQDASSDLEAVTACRAHDAEALRAYENALTSALPIELERLLRGHCTSIRGGLARLEQVRNALM